MRRRGIWAWRGGSSATSRAGGSGSGRARRARVRRSERRRQTRGGPLMEEKRPVRVGGPAAYVAAGSAVTMDVPPGNLGVARGQQRNIPGWVERKRAGTASADAAARAQSASRGEASNEGHAPDGDGGPAGDTARDHS